MSSLFNPGPYDCDFIYRSILRVRLDQSHLSYNPHSFFDASKNCVLAVEMRGWSKGDEELRSIGIGSRIGHAEDTCPCMFQGRVDLIRKLFAAHGKL
jgi:hypothetical protein